MGQPEKLDLEEGHISGHWRVRLWKIKNHHLNQKFFTPVVQIIKRFHRVNIINQNTTIGSTVECNTKTLKPFLTSCVPYLQRHVVKHHKSTDKRRHIKYFYLFTRVQFKSTQFSYVLTGDAQNGALSRSSQNIRNYFELLHSQDTQKVWE